MTLVCDCEWVGFGIRIYDCTLGLGIAFGLRFGLGFEIKTGTGIYVCVVVDVCLCW